MNPLLSIVDRARRDSPRRTVIVSVAFLVVVSLFVGPMTVAATSTSEHPEPSLEVDLDDDGSSDVTLTMTFELTDDDERAAFESIRTDDDARDATITRFETRLSAVAQAMDDRVDRDVSVSNPAISVDVVADGTIGVVHLSLTWNGLATVEGDRLSVTEPFASGYVSDHPLVITGPDGFERVDTTPDPTEETAVSATWESDTTLDTFAVTFERTATEESSANTAVDDSMPGFGLGVGIAAVLSLMAVLGVRQV